jgi:corrinoid protein of di/trimethylamine methyltransferase
MDIEEVKRLYGARVTIIGNIDLHYTLTQGTPEETRQEVKERLQALAPGGRYMLASANSLPQYVKAENVRAMIEALLEFGWYPEDMVDAPRLAYQRKSAGVVHSGAAPVEHSDSDMHPVRLAVSQGKFKNVKEVVEQALSRGESAASILENGMIAAMNDVGQKFSEKEIFIPEMLIAARCMKLGLEVIKPLLSAADSASRGKVVLASVEGDLHDIGKNIVAIMLEGAGFEVIDLGVNVSRQAIVEECRQHQPDFLGLSSLLTTTMPEMGRVIQALEEAGIRKQVRVLVGGAPLSQQFADSIGADGYSKDATGAAQLCRDLLSR